MTAARTVTVQTTDHGPISIPEPSWCLGHVDHVPGFRADLTHVGPAHRAVWNGYELAFAEVVQAPYAEISSADAHVSVELGQLGNSLGPADLDQLADVLVEYAGTLRRLARALPVLRAGGAR